MRATLAALVAAGALLTGCSGGSAPSPTRTGPVDPFTALAPPRGPGVGGFDTWPRVPGLAGA